MSIRAIKLASWLRCSTLIVALGLASRLDAAHVQTNTQGDGSAGTTVAVVLTSTTATNLIACGVVAFAIGNPPDVSTVATSTPQSLALGRRATKAENQGNEIWYLANISGGTVTITATYASSVTFKRITCSEFSGNATSSPLDGSGIDANGNGTSASTGAYSATSTSTFYASVSASSSSSFSVGGSWTIPTNGSGTSDQPGAIAYLVNPGGASQTATFTVTTSGWVTNGVAFLTAGGGGGPQLGSVTTLGAGR